MREHITKHENLTLTILRRVADKERHCGYTYLVQENHRPHKAFRTRAGLRRFLRYAGLKMGARYGNWIKLRGYYYECAQGDPELFSLKMKRGAWVEPVLNNGSFTLGIIHKSDGEHTIEYLPPSVSSRPTCSYFWE